ncbi:GNAT family N-acetyltransferase [Rhodobacteraceae bacterium LMO-12]|nr:GNAT family N-acetyltransferase [Rhodobacteraceae bacterium LMO-JJ12]
MANITIRPPASRAEHAALRALCRDYRASLVDAAIDRPDAVENAYKSDEYEALLKTLPTLHAAPNGALFLGFVDDTPMACGMIHQIAPGTAEIKRVYTAPAARGLGLGRHIVETALDHARTNGARRMVLDTIRPLVAAQKLYETLGFRPIDPFYPIDPGLADYFLFYGRDL